MSKPSDKSLRDALADITLVLILAGLLVGGTLVVGLITINSKLRSIEHDVMMGRFALDQISSSINWSSKSLGSLATDIDRWTDKEVPETTNPCCAGARSGTASDGSSWYITYDCEVNQ